MGEKGKGAKRHLKTLHWQNMESQSEGVEDIATCGKNPLQREP